MRVALLTTSFPRFEGDVAGSFVLGFARALADRGHEVDVLAPDPARGGRPPRWPGVAVRWVPYLRPRTLQRTFYGAGVLDNLRATPAAWPGLATYPATLLAAAAARTGRAEALVSHWALPSALVAGALAGGRPHLAVLHSADVHLLERLPGRATLATHVVRNATHLQLVSRDLHDRFVALLPPRVRAEARAKCSVMPMGTAPAPPVSQPRPALRRGLALRRFTALCLGRLVPIKRTADVIRAVALPGTDTELLVAGDGPERPALEALARRLAAPVRFLGTVSGDAKWDVLRAADTLVAPSHHARRTEGTPVAVLEALAAGLPVVATASGGLADAVRHGHTGLHVPARSPAAIAHALSRLRTDETLRHALGHNARLEGARHHWPARATEIERHLASGAGALSRARGGFRAAG